MPVVGRSGYYSGRATAKGKPAPRAGERRIMALEILRFDWGEFDARAGWRYAFGVALVIVLSELVDFPWLGAGISALLVALINLPGPRRKRIRGILAYIVLGAGLVGLAHLLGGTYWPWLVAMLAVGFLGSLAMIWGPRGYMVGWCLIVWFYVAPLVGAIDDTLSVLGAHVLGSGVMLVLIVLFSPKDVDGAAEDALGEVSAATEEPPLSFVLGYALTVGLVLALGLALGDAWLTDPTMILNASLMVLMPSPAKTWSVGIDRMLGAVLAVFIGFSLGQLAGGPILEVAIWLVSSFFVIAMLRVNAGAVIFFFLLPYAEGWGELGGEQGPQLANERLLAEPIGILLAGVGILILHGLHRRLSRKT